MKDSDARKEKLVKERDGLESQIRAGDDGGNSDLLEAMEAVRKRKYGDLYGQKKLK